MIKTLVIPTTTMSIRGMNSDDHRYNDYTIQLNDAQQNENMEGRFHQERQRHRRIRRHPSSRTISAEDMAFVAAEFRISNNLTRRERPRSVRRILGPNRSSHRPLHPPALESTNEILATEDTLSTLAAEMRIANDLPCQQRRMHLSRLNEFLSRTDSVKNIRDTLSNHENISRP